MKFPESTQGANLILNYLTSIGFQQLHTENLPPLNEEILLVAPTVVADTPSFCGFDFYLVKTTNWIQDTESQIFGWAGALQKLNAKLGTTYELANLNTSSVILGLPNDVLDSEFSIIPGVYDLNLLASMNCFMFAKANQTETLTLPSGETNVISARDMFGLTSPIYPNRLKYQGKFI